MPSSPCVIRIFYVEIFKKTLYIKNHKNRRNPLPVRAAGVFRRYENSLQESLHTPENVESFQKLSTETLYRVKTS